MTTPDPSLGKFKILIAEDDHYLAWALSDKLSRRGFTVEKVANGREAMAKLKENKPDLLILDILMPIYSGFQVMEDIRANADLADISVVVLSNLDQESDIKRAKDLGAIEYLVKSNIKLKAVVAKIEDILRRKD
ncbi:MAG: response regulator [Candidatus Paceibacterota bacterium]